MTHCLRQLLCGMITLMAILTLAGCPGGEPETGIERREDLEFRVLREINRLREEKDLRKLELKADLREVAVRHNVGMIRRELAGDPQAFSHTDAEGRTIEMRLDNAGIDWARAGENLARNFNQPDPVEAAVQGWLQSEEHRRNMLSERFRETGIAVHRSPESGTLYFTQVFLLRMPD